MAMVSWSQSEKEAFLRMQFNTQTTYYRNVFPSMEYQIILRDGQPVGRFIVDRAEKELRLIDIALLAEDRGAGIGGRLIQELLGEAQRTKKAVVLHVETFNRARRLYERLGFREVGTNGVYIQMAWLPDSSVVSVPVADAVN